MARRLVRGGGGAGDKERSRGEGRRFQGNNADTDGVQSVCSVLTDRVRVEVEGKRMLPPSQRGLGGV